MYAISLGSFLSLAAIIGVLLGKIIAWCRKTCGKKNKDADKPRANNRMVVSDFDEIK